jgi:hypothetical protein
MLFFSKAIMRRVLTVASTARAAAEKPSAQARPGWGDDNQRHTITRIDLSPRARQVIDQIKQALAIRIGHRSKDETFYCKSPRN